MHGSYLAYVYCILNRRNLLILVADGLHQGQLSDV
jgi:hypothetical protein